MPLVRYLGLAPVTFRVIVSGQTTVQVDFPTNDPVAVSDKEWKYLSKDDLYALVT